MKYLVIGPGAMGFYSMLGYLKYIEKCLSDVQEISGASAGSILAVLFALGKTVDEMIDVSLKLNISDLVKLNLKCFLHSYGLVDLEALREKFVDICGCDPTFMELTKKIHISAFCVNTGKTEYFSADTHPDMKVLDAVCMSIAIPFVFSSRKYKGNTYVDGGTVESMPLAPFLAYKPYDVHCIQIKSNIPYVENIDNPRVFAENIMRSALVNRYDYDTRDYRVKIIDVGDMDIFDFNMSYEDKIRMLTKGIP
jgi:predicted acylesterase/phospholipase RssA